MLLGSLGKMKEIEIVLFDLIMCIMTETSNWDLIWQNKWLNSGVGHENVLFVSSMGSCPFGAYVIALDALAMPLRICIRWNVVSGCQHSTICPLTFSNQIRVFVSLLFLLHFMHRWISYYLQPFIFPAFFQPKLNVYQEREY